MFDRLKRSLVESFLGALALGWLFAWAILDFVSIFSAPVTNWISRNEYRQAKISGLDGIPATLFLKDALPYVVSSFALFLIGYLLLRWLYFKPLPKSAPSVPIIPEQEPFGGHLTALHRPDGEQCSGCTAGYVTF